MAHIIQPINQTNLGKMDKQQELVNRLSTGLEKMIMQFKSIDVSCMQIKSDLSSRDFHLISFVGSEENLIMKDIADELGVPMSTATGIVDKLVQKKYLQRKYSESDRRIVLIELDEEGREAYNLFAKMKIQASEQILSKLNKSEAEEFINYLEKIAIGFTMQPELV